MQTSWRLAFMFDAPGGDLAVLEQNLKAARNEIVDAAAGSAVRLGVAIRNDEPDASQESHDSGSWRTVDGAVEVTIANGREGEAPAICRALRPILESLSAPGSLEVMTGAMHHMVPVRPGGAFLSLSFRRGPGTSVTQFRDWWLNQHSKVAVPVLGEHLLAYDQVHIDTGATRAAAEALGVTFADYDAYDNLTFVNQQGFIASVSDAPGMQRIAEDEIGWIDNSSRRHALMRDIG
jgi:EthD domain